MFECNVDKMWKELGSELLRVYRVYCKDSEYRVIILNELYHCVSFLLGIVFFNVSYGEIVNALLCLFHPTGFYATKISNQIMN